MLALQESRTHGPKRSHDGCWTCRLRRKKCDENRPVCKACATLCIMCHYQEDKPEWMDGADLQKEKAERVKREIRDRASRRREGRAVDLADDGIQVAEATNGKWVVLGQDRSTTSIEMVSDAAMTSEEDPDSGSRPCPRTPTAQPGRRADCSLARVDNGIGFGRADTVLLSFYIESVFPFLFPFYQPSAREGGRAWILEMIISSPVVRQSALSQSSYCYSHESRTNNCDAVWHTVLTQAQDAFEVLRQSLQVIGTASINEHLHGAVRILASIIQVQRFEVTVLSFENCQAHLNAALALFQQILGSSVDAGQIGALASFNDVFDRLGPPSWILPASCIQVPSAEQAAFRFSSGLLILDDIIASTVLQERPKLYESHRCLLDNIHGNEPCVNLEAVIGCQNWALKQLGEVAVLDAWKQQRKRAGNLDVMELVRRATVIEAVLKDHLARLDSVPTAQTSTRQTDIFTNDVYPLATALSSQTLSITRIWAHSALLYLSIVVSGFQSASVGVQNHVQQIVELISHHLSSPSLLRTVSWPFCVAGCLAGPELEAQLRAMVMTLQPPGMFVTVHKALQIMEHVWSNRERLNCDLASCIRNAGGFVLLV